MAIGRWEFYEKECIKANWSVRELKRQIATSLFERLLLSKREANKETVLELSQKGIETDLEQSLVQHIEKFLLELGRGFMFVGTQQRVTLGNEHYYVDIVFYNKLPHCYVLI